MKSNNKSLLSIISDVADYQPHQGRDANKFVEKVLYANPDPSGNIHSKGDVIKAFRTMKKNGEIGLSDKQEKQFFENIRMKNVRTISGVTPVTVLTKPFPCPGKCIFCPNDVRMPKSYLSNEPGAQRAESNKFDPYFQTFNRLVALNNIGHPTDKIEIIILGGTWTSYPESYQVWFVKRIFEALNDFDAKENPEVINPEDIEMPYAEDLLAKAGGDSINRTYNQIVTEALNAKKHKGITESASWDELFKEHERNVSAKTRCVGLVIETRPDEINQEEVIRIRRLGATKIQLGVQSLDDEVLKQNKRGHDVLKTAEAFKIVREAGFKIHIHWMPNLLGSTPEKDIDDYRRLFDDPRFRPDEIKIYPCSLIESAELMKYYKNGSWKPYSYGDLLKVLTFAYKYTPSYCRITRMIRDIPSTDIVAGNLKTNFRQLVENNLDREKHEVNEIRSREIKNQNVDYSNLKLNTISYDSAISEEFFIEFTTHENRIVAFLRLSLPYNTQDQFIDELKSSAIIREVHVYGRSMELGKKHKGGAQHAGLGNKLIHKAFELATNEGFKKIAVISSIGTKEYYNKYGFNQTGLYQIKEI
ncbi:tRNA uridine(34) 5-carboxymethylaminomethyl modification radical SAM/GNAT enzyme Elp3 [candidate division WWE3 bacterium]|jgi:elongator complex protein 3|uniref:tRNA carboxymethyluridine synthase n=1 Tax=candidate division WWE3 bacterium TaxID=2053526 RepID=A0A3A4ZFA2_UNCKA|nr:MAG: tRNA uridine(34) 5-carboxymethylaminomethyl modification radical SAM/GNAT enzyme Elp3 [candidate division WWE3 bacterium]